MIIGRNTWSILGLPFDAVDLKRSLALIEQAIEQNTHCFLSTPNLNFATAAQSDKAFFNSVVDSDLSVVDGMPLVWVARLLGVPIKERVAGSTLFDELSSRPREKKIRIYFFGGQQGVAERAHTQLNDTSVGMLSCGFYDPGFVSIEQMSDRDLLHAINTAKPDFIVVALGAKKGQAWIQKNREYLKAPVISHLGAVINFVAGNIQRAPKRWQKFGLEWVWRIKQEKSLWKRYFYDGLMFIKMLLIYIFPLAIYDRLLKRSVCYKQPCVISPSQKADGVVFLNGSFKASTLESVKQVFSSILSEEKEHVIIDCFKLSYIDAAFIATLMLFQARLAKQGRELILTKVPKRISTLLVLNNVGQRFKVKR
ncbi:WecB/TagA/CpsF family glycosyltransferase [uncultured Cycloclasticus sp.]|uniref:WecB/TagA/CpsF family glycosyltransferase n=1 Tax=uncultured Cycloclasticus sp. TaxID=172194 RepID=UPI0025851D6D|nr:WecB/TagA/CpsF family glycosyltransferase [uncultured Cycloclasticus sp.]